MSSSSSFFSGSNATPTEYQTGVNLVAQATQQATAALASQNAAATSAQTAQGYSVSAGTSATTATNQASSAATSAAGAATSATNASTSATNAASSASSASTSATNAASSASAASTSATNASNSASAAATSATNASNSASAAATSASNAASTLASALTKSDNLASLTNVATARSNLGLVASATTDTTNASNITSGTLSNFRLSGVVLTANNLSDLTSASTARTNLGLATVAATGAYGDLSGRPSLVASATTDTTNASNITSGTLSNSRLSGVALTANNLSDLASASSARTNLGLTDLATTTPGTGVTTALGVNVGSAGAFVTNGGALGTPSSGNLANCTFPTLNQNTTGTASNVTGTVAVANGGTGLTSLTAGYIPYGNGTGAFSSSANLYFSGSNLGLGTPSPSGVIHAYKASSSSAIITQSQGTTSADVGLFSAYGGNYLTQLLQYGSGPTTLYTTGTLLQFLTSTSAPIIFTQNTTEAMRIDASGALLMGTASALAGGDLEIRRSSTSLNLDLYSANVSGNPKVRFYNNSNQGAIGYTSDAALAFYNNSTTTERMRLDSAGNLGVGTTSPSYRLHVANSSLTSTSPFANIISTFRSNASNADVCIQFSDGTAYDSRFGQIGGTAGAFGFFVGGTERARISDDGTFRVRGTGTAGSTDAVQFSGSAPASSLLLDAGGNLVIATGISTGSGLSTGDATIELGSGRTGSGNCYIDFHSQASTDADFRFIRDGGANGDARIMLAGTGSLAFHTNGSNGNAGSAQERARIDASGNLLVGTTSAGTLLTVNGVATLCSGTATPAGGSTSARLLFGTTAGFGIYYGSGEPTVSAAQGSIYLRSDGSSTSTRMYVNTNGSTTWTNVTTAA